MKDNFTGILELCLEQLKRGQSLGDVLAQYPDQRDRLEPLLRAALRFEEQADIQPSSEFVENLAGRLSTRHQELQATKYKRSRTGKSSLLHPLLWSFGSLKRVMASAAVILLVAVLASFALLNILGQKNLF